MRGSGTLWESKIKLLVEPQISVIWGTGAKWAIVCVCACVCVRMCVVVMISDNREKPSRTGTREEQGLYALFCEDDLAGISDDVAGTLLFSWLSPGLLLPRPEKPPHTSACVVRTAPGWPALPQLCSWASASRWPGLRAGVHEPPLHLPAPTWQSHSLPASAGAPGLKQLFEFKLNNWVDHH